MKKYLFGRLFSLTLVLLSIFLLPSIFFLFAKALISLPLAIVIDLLQVRIWDCYRQFYFSKILSSKLNLENILWSFWFLLIRFQNSLENSTENLQIYVLGQIVFIQQIQVLTFHRSLCLWMDSIVLNVKCLNLSKIPFQLIGCCYYFGIPNSNPELFLQI